MPVAVMPVDAELIGRFYDAAIDERLWEGVSLSIAEAVSATSAVMKIHAPGDSVRLLEMTDNLMEADRRGDWARHWHANDLWVNRSVAFGPSRIVTSQQLVSEAEQRASGFYQEWLRELDIFHMIGAVFPVSDGEMGVIGLHRPRDGQPFDHAERYRMGILLPHLRRALKLGYELAQAALLRDATLDGLDMLDTGAMIVDAHCRLVHANLAAGEMLRAGDAIQSQEGCLRTTDAAVQARLLAAVRQAVMPTGGSATAVRLDRPDGPPCSLLVAPMRTVRQDFFPRRPVALVLARDCDRPAAVDTLRDLFGLTRSEARVAAQLAQGQALAEISAWLGIELGTVRTHLKQVLLKTETNRQAEAVAVITRSAAMLRRPRKDR